MSDSAVVDEERGGNRPVKKAWLWLVVATLFFPVVQLSVFGLRYNRLPSEMILESLYFAPLGLIAGLLLIWALNNSISGSHRRIIWVGFGFALPFAIIASLMSGLLLPPLIGTVLFGTPPLAIGVGLGFFIGKRLAQ